MILLSHDAVEDVERLRAFLDHANPGAARRAIALIWAARAIALIWAAMEKLQDFPALGMPTDDPEIRQIVVRFGASGYIVRYVILPETADILVTRVWHGREARI